jgi:hypothetical protein
MTGPSDIGDADIETPFDHGPPRIIDCFNGDDFLGSVAIGRSIRAVRPDGSEISTFDSIEEARAAVVRDAFSRAEAASW